MPQGRKIFYNGWRESKQTEFLKFKFFNFKMPSAQHYKEKKRKITNNVFIYNNIVYIKKDNSIKAKKRLKLYVS